MVAATAIGSLLSGCQCLDFHGTVHTTGKMDGDVTGKFKVESTQFPDLGPMAAQVVRCPASGHPDGRIAVVDLDGLIVNQNMTGLNSAGENPVAAFREKLALAATDPSIRAIVLRINSPGGGVAASVVMAEELRRFRLGTGKPVVACLMDLATGGAYYVAVGADSIVAQPGGTIGSIGAVVNYYNLELAMTSWNITADTVKSGELVDMGSALRTITGRRAGALPADRGRACTAVSRTSQAEPPIHAAQRLRSDQGWPNLHGGACGKAARCGSTRLSRRRNRGSRATDPTSNPAEVVMLQRAELPIRSMYAIPPNTPMQNTLFPMSIPGLERSKLPTFLYLWEPDPTITRLAPP